MSGYELSEDYPLSHKENAQHPDLGKGLQRSMPIEYDRTGRRRPKKIELPYTAFAIVCVIIYAVAKAMP